MFSRYRFYHGLSFRGPKVDRELIPDKGRAAWDITFYRTGKMGGCKIGKVVGVSPAK